VLSMTNFDGGWHKPCNVQNNKTYDFVVLCSKISFYGGGHEMWMHKITHGSINRLQMKFAKGVINCLPFYFYFGPNNCDR